MIASSLYVVGSAAWAQSAVPPPGHTRSLVVPRAAAPPVIDGKLDDAVWNDAARATEFWISEYRRVPAEPTEIRVLATDKALYVAFMCSDSRPQEIHAEQLKRDGSLDLDDHVTVQLDPYHNHRQISDFSVNARGTQSDAIAGGRARKIEWKGDWQAAVQHTDGGWTAEMALPFAILNFQPGARTFGVNFLRYHHRTQEWSRWADVTPQFLPEEAGHLQLEVPKTVSARKLTIMQYAAGGYNALGKQGQIRDTTATTGVDARYSIANNLTSVLSLNPDFSQVEEAVLGLSFDYNEKYRADPRPFFQEGSGFFGSRSYFYSARVPNFDWGLKSFGKIGPLQLGVLGVDAPQGRRDYVARVLRELGPTLSTALTLVGTERQGFDNHLVSLEAGGRLGRRLAFDLDLATTSTRGRSGDGSRLGFAFSHQHPYWQAGFGFDRTDLGYFPANGFVASDVLGTQGGSTFVSYGREYAGGPFRRANGSVTYGMRETRTGLTQRRSFSIYVGGETRSNIQINLGGTVGPYRPRGKNPGEWSSRLNDDRFYTASIYFDTRSDRRGYGLTYSWGFLGGGDYADLAPSFWFKPTRNTYLSYSYERAESFGVSVQSILSLSWELSPEEAISARWVESDGHSYRLAYRRQMRRGTDIFAVFNKDPYTPERFTIKLVRTLSLGSGRARRTLPGAAARGTKSSAPSGGSSAAAASGEAAASPPEVVPAPTVQDPPCSPVAGRDYP